MRPGLLAAGLAFLLAGTPAAAEEERPKIFLEKRIVADTAAGKKSFYEVHTVAAGESLWKILSRKTAFAPSEFGPLLDEFRKANPDVADPGRLRPGQKVLVPSASAPREPRDVPGRTALHKIARGDNLTKLLRAKGVSGQDLPRYLEAVRELNASVRDVNRIIAGKTILLPEEGYFSAAAESAPPPAVALTKDVAEQPAPDIAEAAKPEAQILPPAAPPPAAPAATIAGPAVTDEPPKKEEPPPVPPKPPYRGLLADILAGLGEKWVDKGTLYLPVPGGGEVVLNLEEFPVARFSNGVQALVDFRGGLPRNVRSLVSETWKNYRVVSMDGSAGAGGMIDRLLEGSGYHSVKDGLAHPLVIGERVSVTLPARWVVLKTPRSLETGEVILVKEVPERPPGDLAAVLRYADRVGIRVLPFATDPSAHEGFVVGVEEDGGDDPPVLSVPPSGLPALDFALDYLGIPRKAGERLQIGGRGEAFQLVVRPERIFETGGRRYAVDAGTMTPALRTLVKDAGYVVLTVTKEEAGRSIFQRVLKEAGIAFEERREFLLSGEAAGYAVRATGTFLTSQGFLEGKNARAAVLVRGRVHSATRSLLRDLGVEIVEW